jgi:hypothetical protein
VLLDRVQLRLEIGLVMLGGGGGLAILVGGDGERGECGGDG